MQFPQKLILRIQTVFRRFYFAQPQELGKKLIRFTRSESVLILIAAGIGIAAGGVILLFNWAVELPWWVESSRMTQPNERCAGSITLPGD